MQATLQTKPSICWIACRLVTAGSVAILRTPNAERLCAKLQNSFAAQSNRAKRSPLRFNYFNVTRDYRVRRRSNPDTVPLNTKTRGISTCYIFPPNGYFHNETLYWPYPHLCSPLATRQAHSKRPHRNLEPVRSKPRQCAPCPKAQPLSISCSGG